ncbi:MFS transporter [Streptomyces albicerus]|uniref:MFS transporter n=1 Tax=Streptomyces albicerus TaxID=2569859 RepID=UPI00124AE71B|nr:MFS transporter [Streptomyces albicerus]
MADERIDKSGSASLDGQPPDPLRWKALALLGTAFFMTILDSTIVLTAVPSMAADLHLSVSGVQWVLTGYVLTFGALMLLGGRLADLTGRRRVFMVGTMLFVLSSLMCALASSGGILIASRLAQGVSAALMAPTALAILMTTFTEGTERNKALGIWGGLGGVGATAGLLVGGVVTSSFGWEWIFYINVPIGLGILALSPVLLRESRARGLMRSFDFAGAATVAAALALLLYAIFKAPAEGWISLTSGGLLVVSAALFLLFVFIEARAAAPLVPLRVFRLRSLVSGNLTIFAVGLAVDGMLFPLTLYAQDVLGYSAMQFGLMSAVMTVMSVVGAMAGQAMVTKMGLRRVAVPSLLLIMIGCLLLVWVSADGSYREDVLLGLLIFGPGMGGAFVAAQIAALTGVAEEESGLAAGLVDTSFNIGSALGIAIVTTVAVSRTNEMLAAGGPQTDHAIALTEGYQSAFLVTVVFAAIGLIAAFFLSGSPQGQETNESAESSPVKSLD